MDAGWIALGMLAAIAALVGWGIAAYNRFVALDAQARAAWADVDVLLKRRANLIPNLVETVKGYMRHERETLTKVTQARRLAAQARTPAERSAAEAGISQALGRLFALAESYPELKANANFLDLQKQLAEAEDLIQNARRYYNAVVRDYNTRLRSFPDLIVAGMFRFRPLEYFELDDAAARQPPIVRFP
ncbi:MAG: LemA family protein [Zetaproteobacteria bacterium]|nr:MAG: LemA family protein [Zetaproteobacteria bacterium]